MALSRIQSKTYATNDWLNTFNFAFTSSVTAGSLLVVGISSGNASGSITGFADSSGQTWTAITPVASADNSYLYVYYLANANAGTHTITVTLNDYYQSTVVAREYGGMLTSSVLDVSSSAADADWEITHPAGTTATTSQASTLSVLLSAGFENSGAFTAGSGFSNAQYIVGSGATNIGMQDREDSAVGTKTGSITTTNYVRQANLLAVFKIDTPAVTNYGLLGMF